MPTIPSFTEIQAILNRLVKGKTAYLTDIHGSTFLWNTRDQLCNAIVQVHSGTYRLLPPDMIRNKRGAETFLVQSLRNPSGVDSNGRMPLDGNIDGDYATNAEIEKIIAWIDGGCPA